MSESVVQPGSLSDLLKKTDRVLLVTLAVMLMLAAFAPEQVTPTVTFTSEALFRIAPFIVLAVLAAAWTKATGLDGQIATVFKANPVPAIFLASLFGAFSPFCSCGVVPIIAGLLAAGVPLAPVMAFMIASPLMDPEIFILMVAEFGLAFTLVKAGAAVVLGLTAGYATHMLTGRGLFSSPVRDVVMGGCGSGCKPKSGIKDKQIVWRFWEDRNSRGRFWSESGRTGFFLGKWLLLAFVLESLMVAYIPAETIGSYLGGDGWWTIPASVLMGIPAYLNGYAAVPTVSGLMELGMAPGAAMGFMIAGGVTSIPAAMAVLALMKRGAFAWYIALGLSGSLASGVAAQGILG